MGFERQSAISAKAYISLHPRPTAEGCAFDDNALCDSRFKRSEASGSFGGDELKKGLVAGAGFEPATSGL